MGNLRRINTREAMLQLRVFSSGWAALNKGGHILSGNDSRISEFVSSSDYETASEDSIFSNSYVKTISFSKEEIDGISAETAAKNTENSKGFNLPSLSRSKWLRTCI